uniref:Uncharacterized protein n=1 Tax=Knipowitschia caucasica TaxID=637954 RepID=A0AAV2L7F7_KNICA
MLQPKQKGAAVDQFMEEWSWCLAWGALGHRPCHCSTAVIHSPHPPPHHSAHINPPSPSPLLCGRPHLKGVPYSPPP